MREFCEAYTQSINGDDGIADDHTSAHFSEKLNPNAKSEHSDRDRNIESRIKQAFEWVRSRGDSKHFFGNSSHLHHDSATSCCCQQGIHNSSVVLQCMFQGLLVIMRLIGGRVRLLLLVLVLEVS